MADSDLKKELDGIASKYENMEVRSASFDEEKGQLTMELSLAGGPQIGELPEGVEVVSPADMIGDVRPLSYAAGSLRRIDVDPLLRSDLDLAKTSVLQDEPQQIYARSIEYYRSKEVYGSAINALTNFASKGFENDIDDNNIKDFYDSWVIDVGFDDFVEKVFLDFFRIGMVRTYKVLGKYEPKVSFLSSIPGRAPPVVKKAKAVRRNRYSASFIPIGYTILNPTMVLIKGSLMFGQTATFLKKEAGTEIKQLLEMKKADLSEFQRKIIDSLPADFKKAILKGNDIPLDPDLIGEVDYRRMPYERYPLPRGSRAFEAVEFKDELRKADYSTLDGITNYILLVKVGNDSHPVKKQETLERAAEMFDTVSKSYKVVWNHTIEVEKITSPEIGEILGPEKYIQVNGDITGGLGVIRALIDGLGDSTPAATELAVKSVIEEINYARRQVSRWIYREYRAVAEAMGFNRIPRVRFDDMALRDEIQMMSIVQGMIDRRIISYRTGQKKLGFDPDTELSQMEEERPLVEDGVLGILGSPFQQSGRGQDQAQPNQGTPKGTPSEGRPRGRPAKTPRDSNSPRPSGAPSKKQAAAEEIAEVFSQLSLEELEKLVAVVKSSLVSKAEEEKPPKKKPTRKGKKPAGEQG